MPDGGRIVIRTSMIRDMVALGSRTPARASPWTCATKVFSPFFSTKGKGSGLGLAMIRKIMDDIGGDVQLSSREGSGTTVTFAPASVLAVTAPAD
jgi:C4-dicarboxylate-specific signal transduction histidine kinase